MDGPTFHSLVNLWMNCEGYNPLDVLKHTSAVAVLGELSVGGSLMRGAQESSATRNEPLILVPDLLAYYHFKELIAFSCG